MDRMTLESISIPPAHVEMIKMIAKSKKVSRAWVYREAIERYLAEVVGEKESK